jgi:putative membrane protein
MTSQTKHNQTQEPPTQLELAVDRTFLAYERSLMAWLRTSLAMVTFGFTMIKAYFYLITSGTLLPSRQIMNPRTYGLFIIALGIIALLGGIWQHVRALRNLRTHTDRIPPSMALGPALLFALLAMAAMAISIIENRPDVSIHPPDLEQGIRPNP